MKFLLSASLCTLLCLSFLSYAKAQYTPIPHVDDKHIKDTAQITEDVRLNNRGVELMVPGLLKLDISTDSALKLAILQFDAGLEINPNNYLLYVNKSQAQTELGRYEEAAATLENMLKIKYYPEGIIGLGITYEMAGEKDKAMQKYEEAISLCKKRQQADSSSPHDVSNMAFAMFMLDKKEESLELINERLQQSPDDKILLEARSILKQADREDFINASEQEGE